MPPPKALKNPGQPECMRGICQHGPEGAQHKNTQAGKDRCASAETVRVGAAEELTNGKSCQEKTDGQFDIMKQ